MALYYSSVLSFIFNSITYKNSAKTGNFIFNVNKKFFPYVKNNQLEKQYSNKEIYFIYRSLNMYYE